jgi:hypothetical protein
MEVLMAMAESIAPLLLAEGIGCPDAERVLRSVCVNEAARAEEAKGNRPNASRLALLTGLDRHVVGWILRLGPKTDPSKIVTRRHRLNRVLVAWHTDPAYSEGGRPKALEIQGGPRRKSFWTLSKANAKDAYPPLILQELMKVGAVEQLRDGRVRPRARAYKAMELDQVAVKEIGRRVRDLTRTMLGNLSAEEKPRICKTVQIEVGEEQLELMRAAVEERSEALLGDMDQLLNSPRWRRKPASGRRVRIAWTCYSAEEPLSDGSAAEKEPRVARGRPPSAPVRVAAKKVTNKTGW